MLESWLPSERPPSPPLARSLVIDLGEPSWSPSDDNDNGDHDGAGTVGMESAPCWLMNNFARPPVRSHYPFNQCFFRLFIDSPKSISSRRAPAANHLWPASVLLETNWAKYKELSLSLSLKLNTIVASDFHR